MRIAESVRRGGVPRSTDLAAATRLVTWVSGSSLATMAGFKGVAGKRRAIFDWSPHAITAAHRQSTNNVFTGEVRSCAPVGVAVIGSRCLLSVQS